MQPKVDVYAEWAASLRPGELPGVCRYNLGVDPTDDCGKRPEWHVRYAEPASAILSCAGHFGNSLRPVVMNGVWLDRPVPIKAMHRIGPSCLLDTTEPTWWVDELNICVTVDQGLALGVLAEEADTPWMCGVCEEWTRTSHYRTNSDGTVRHEIFGINHSPLPSLFGDLFDG